MGYKVLEIRKKRKKPAILSVYDALQMSQELRELLIEALSNPKDYPDDMGPPDISVIFNYFLHRRGEVH